MKEEKYLPIGSVCQLKNGTRKIMVTGFVAQGKEVEGVFDYVGCLYPEGVISSDQNLLFNHDQIDKIFYVGYKNEEEVAFKAKLKDYVENNSVEEL